jgi:alpha-amylase
MRTAGEIFAQETKKIAAFILHKTTTEETRLVEWILLLSLAFVIGLLFAPRERGLLEEAHVHVTESLAHLQASPVPDWVRGMTLYEVFPRVYPPDGTFEALRRDLPRIADLGVKCIWLMPIHPTGQKGRKGRFGSPYAVRDYFAIDPDLGNEADLRRLVSDVHAAGMRIIIDMVLNHAANDHVELESHPDWFARDRHGAVTRRVSGWSDVADWDQSNPEVLDYLREVLLYWVREFDLDGYRCDVAGMLPLTFWEQVRQDLDALKPDLFLLAEADDPRMHLKAFDATYDWDLLYKMQDVRRGKAAAGELADLIALQEKLYPEGSVLLRFLENHDLPRAADRFGVRAFRPFAVLAFTASGIPLIYNGQEMGMRKWPDLFEKEILDWQSGSSSVLGFYRRLVKLRQQHPVFFDGETLPVDTNEPSRVGAFARVSESQTAVIAVNCGPKPVEVRLTVPHDLFRHENWRIFSSRQVASCTPQRNTVLSLPAWGYWVAVSMPGSTT